jgi:microcystin-dependent protein
VAQAIATPTRWLLCDGSNVSRGTYAQLFRAIGITYGAGDGSTTFTLPNLNGAPQSISFSRVSNHALRGIH